MRSSALAGGVFSSRCARPPRYSRPVIATKLKDQPLSERPRERLRDKGPDSLSPAELVAILLRTGLKGVNVVEIGKRLLQRYGSLDSLARNMV